MSYLFRVVSFVVFVGVVGFGAEPPTEAELAKGKKLYAAAGSCIACHMPDGTGQPGSIPPLAGSEWLSDTDRSIAISLRGLAGPIKVNDKRFYSAMPPQLLFDDAELASILTYVNFAWGNEKQAGEIVAAEDVTKARATLPPEVYNPYKLLKAFPFEKKFAKRNGPFKPDFDDALLVVDKPVVYRTFMPGASPAAFAVALPGNQFYCWDAGECRLRYVWTKGGFIKGNKRHWSSNGKPVAEFNGQPYYRARSSLIKPEDEELLTRTNLKNPIYDTTEATDFPVVIEGVNERPRFLGYRLEDGYPVFRVRLGKHEIRESIRLSTNPSGGAASKGVRRSFEVDPPAALTLKLTPNPNAILSSTVGTIANDGRLVITAEQAASFAVTMHEKSPTILPVEAGSEGGAK